MMMEGRLRLEWSGGWREEIISWIHNSSLVEEELGSSLSLSLSVYLYLCICICSTHSPLNIRLDCLFFLYINYRYS